MGLTEGVDEGGSGDVLVMGSPFLYIVFKVWRVTFLRCCAGGLPIGECEECRTWRPLGAGGCRCEAGSDDDEPLSDGDRVDSDDSVLHEEWRVFAAARDMATVISTRYGGRSCRVENLTRSLGGLGG